MSKYINHSNFFNKRTSHLLLIIFLSACSASLDMQGINPVDYYAENPIENKLDENGKLISPNCPDWKTSPTTTYSNSKQGNIGCATVHNLGVMLDNPRDLVKGASGGKIIPDSDRSSDAIYNYRTLNSSKSGASASSSATSTAEGAADLSGSSDSGDGN